MLNKQDIFPFAIGTFGLGGERYESVQTKFCNDVLQQDLDLSALHHSIECGQNYIETSFIYAGGATMELLSRFFSQIPRSKIFITVKIESGVNNPGDIENQIDKYLRIMKLNYADSILLHTPFVANFPVEDAYAEMQKIMAKGKSRYISASNLSPQQLKFAVEDFGLDLFGFEGLYNLDNKINEDNGILDYCHQNGVLFIGYQPLRRNRIAIENHPVVLELSKKYNKSQNQIILNWLVKEKRIIPIVKTSNKNHIDDNIDSLNFEILPEDMQKLNDFRNNKFDAIKIDWENCGGIPIYKLPNQL